MAVRVIASYWSDVFPSLLDCPFPNIYLRCILTFSAYYIIRIGYRKRRHLPPGPLGHPFVGNIFQITSALWVTFDAWKRHYGSLIYVELLGRPVVVINTHQVAADLLDRRSLIYSDRPRSIVGSEILTGGLVVVLMQYGLKWKAMRRAAHEGLTKAVIVDFRRVQMREALLMVVNLDRHSEPWDKVLRKSMGSLMIRFVYGLSSTENEVQDIFPRMNHFVNRLVTALYPGTYFVEFLPWMLHLPNWMTKWRSEAQRWFKEDDAMFQKLFQDVKSVHESRPNIEYCFSLFLAEHQDESGLSNQDAAWLSGTMYAAGAETTSGVLSWFILAMIVYPHVQDKAQAELDDIVGRCRVPTFSDMPHLPYIQAIVKESLRWQPVSPLGSPHRLMKDDVYDGYLIPKGTLCIPNVWSMNRDPEVYGPDAHEFNPDRWLIGGRVTNSFNNTREDGHHSYGFGGRLCVGRYLANDSLFINIACLLWALRLQPRKDGDGQRLASSPDAFTHTGLVIFRRRPAAFDCDFTHRFSEAAILLAHGLEI